MEFSNRSGLITHALFCLQNLKKIAVEKQA